ncbi:TRAP transporter large permease subunit [Chloroflexota bacterium]
MDWYLSLIILFGILLLLMSTGLPIAFALALLGIISLFLFWPAGLEVVGAISIRSSLNFVLVAIPLFIFMGELLLLSGISRDIFDLMQKWFGAVPGSLAVGSLGMGTIFAALTGSNTANTALVGTICIPEMVQKNYYRPLAIGAVGAGGALGILIPPSIAMLLYAALGEQNAAKLFIAGIIPGIIISSLLITYVIIACKVNPDWAPGSIRFSWHERIMSLRYAWPVLALIMLVLGTIYLGVATPTEASAIGTAGALILAAFRRTFTWTNIQQAVFSTVRLTSMIMFILVGAILFSRVLTIMGISEQLITFLTTLPVPPLAVIVGINIIILILGCLMDSSSLIAIFTPLLVPIVIGLGLDPIWFGVLFTINIEVGCLTPPVGYNLFVIKGILPEAGLGEIIRGITPFVIIYIIGMALMIAFPELILWLPSLMD